MIKRAQDHPGQAVVMTSEQKRQGRGIVSLKQSGHQLHWSALVLFSLAPREDVAQHTGYWPQGAGPADALRVPRAGDDHPGGLPVHRLAPGRRYHGVRGCPGGGAGAQQGAPHAAGLQAKPQGPRHTGVRGIHGGAAEGTHGSVGRHERS